METRTGGYANGVANSAQYLLKTNPQGDAIDCSIERLEGESDHAYAQRIEKVFESARVHNQKNLYQFNSLSLHPSEGEKFTDAQMIEMAKEVYLKNGVKNGLTENRHTMFVVERNTKHHHVHAMIHLTDLETKKVNNKMIDYNPIIQKLELKYGLYNEHRKPKEEPENKKKLKDNLKAIRDRSISPSEFLILANKSGYEIHHNGNDAYSLTKDNQTFKASDLGMSYKTLKKALGDDPEFSTTLARLDAKRAKNDGLGAISFDMYVTQADLDQYEAKKQKSNRVLDTRFDSRNDHDFFFKDTNKKAFKYDAMRGRVDFNNNSPTAVKAGLQKLTENVKKPTSFKLGGSDYAKREIWLQFHLMGLDKKGHTLSGYSPTLADKAKLEKEKNKFGNTSSKATDTDKPNDPKKAKKEEHKSKSSAAAVSDLVDAVKLESITESKTKSAAVNALTDMTNSFSFNSIEDKFSEMRVLEKGIKDKNEEAESQHHQKKKRKRNMPHPD